MKYLILVLLILSCSDDSKNGIGNLSQFRQQGQGQNFSASVRLVLDGVSALLDTFPQNTHTHNSWPIIFSKAELDTQLPYFLMNLFKKNSVFRRELNQKIIEESIDDFNVHKDGKFFEFKKEELFYLRMASFDNRIVHGFIVIYDQIKINFIYTKESHAIILDYLQDSFEKSCFPDENACQNISRYTGKIAIFDAIEYEVGKPMDFIDIETFYNDNQ